MNRTRRGLASATFGLIGILIAAPASAENVIQPNTVDFEAPGLTIALADFANDIAAVYPVDFGAVIEGEVLTGSREYLFGANQTKRIHFGLVAGQHWGAQYSPNNPITISGESTYAFSTYTYGPPIYSMQILDGLPNEKVVEFGLSVMSVNGHDYGDVTVTTWLASGGTVSATRHIFESQGLGDTFFGFAAPDGDYFTQFGLTVTGDAASYDVVWVDDIGFVTENIPEPATGTMFLLGALFLGRRRRGTTKYVPTLPGESRRRCPARRSLPRHR
jgi:hypothetical protein